MKNQQHQISVESLRSDVVTGQFPLQDVWRGQTSMVSHAQSNKYYLWYCGLMAAALSRGIPVCYTEVHHIQPRSLGGGDDASNLVRLTYREHFLAHWLLTKFTVGGQLRRMQRALFAMTLKCTGERITSGWQFEAAKRAIRDLELDPELEAAWRERYEAAQAAEKEALKAHLMRRMIERTKTRKQVLLDVAAGQHSKSNLYNLATDFILAHRRHPKRPPKGDRRKDPLVQLFPHPSRAERIRQARAVVEEAGGDFDAILNEAAYAASRPPRPPLRIRQANKGRADG